MCSNRPSTGTAVLTTGGYLLNLNQANRISDSTFCPSVNITHPIVGLNFKTGSEYLIIKRFSFLYTSRAFAQQYGTSVQENRAVLDP